MADQETNEVKEGIPGGEPGAAPKKEGLFPKRYKTINDYTIRVQLDARGRERQVPVYIGPYFCPLHTDEDYKRFRLSVIIGSVLILAASFVLLFFDGYAVYPHEALYTLIPLILGLFPFAYMVMGFARMPRANGKMQRDVYARSVRRIFRSSIAIAVCAAASIVLFLVFLFTVKGVVLTWWDALFVAAILIVLGSGLVVYLLARKLSYESEGGEAPHDLHDAESARSEN